MLGKGTKEELENDILELENLKIQAQRERVKLMLQQNIDSLKPVLLKAEQEIEK